ncbi:hypothetical protein DVK05_04495 [Halorubrum sp. Atlit-8R]|uniref:DUF7112 family protein n=1 Tax=unclassified Halorubrum TaxID=2642239 RepID=UPI000EF282AC|nr:MULTISPECIES: hypothetical protein [unclassified Halorubrum]RLM70792.1 hypothetical protein DVK08_01265 [Halorubrum sp. Atlit-9R]RLM71660.1 hypothetical protein DVK08_06005 [Halorubrum sp. Atlit-9R]RLM83055.1 hypothetical protein DVK05_04495 [Halorubrum sp. Atlit-8R]
MPRVPSDGEDVSSIRVSLARSGGTRRPCVRLPDDDALDGRVESGACDALGVSAGDVIRVAIDREEYHARVAADSNGRLLRGAYDNRRLAREAGEGANRLVEWLDANGREPGDSVVLDVVVPGELYGLRIPGERTLYDANRGPRSSLADIARDLDG